MYCLFRNTKQQNRPRMTVLRHTKETGFVPPALIRRHLGG